MAGVKEVKTAVGEHNHMALLSVMLQPRMGFLPCLGNPRHA